MELTNFAAVRRRSVCILLAFALLLVCGIFTIAVLQHNGAFLAPWRDKVTEADINGDALAETLTLQSRRLLITDAAGGTVWASDDGWLVEDYLLGDIDNDGSEELLLLVWRRGSFGEKKPFWVEKDERSYSQHIFIYKTENPLRAVWMSSALHPEVKSWDLPEPGVLHIITPQGEDTRWGWVSWGLERLDGAHQLV